MTARSRWSAVWPPLLAVVVVSAVGAPAAVASYRHARDVVASTGDVVMAPWLPLSVDGMLVAALVVIWVRRHRGERGGRGPWAAFWFGLATTVAANLAAVDVPTVRSVAVALFPPLALAVTLELVALVANRARPAGRPGDEAGEPIVVHELDDVDAEDVRNDDTLDEHGLSRLWETAPPAGDDPGDDRVTALIRDGAGRRRLAAELGLTEHAARELLAAHKTNGSKS